MADNEEVQDNEALMISLTTDQFGDILMMFSRDDATLTQVCLMLDLAKQKLISQHLFTAMQAKAQAEAEAERQKPILYKADPGLRV